MALRMLMTRDIRFVAGRTYQDEEVPAELRDAWLHNGYAVEAKDKGAVAENKDLGAAPGTKAAKVSRILTPKIIDIIRRQKADA